MEDIANILCHIFHYSIQHNHDENFRHLFSINGCLLQEINIHQWSINIKHFMLAHPVFHNIPIDTYIPELLPTVMIADADYITLPLNWIKMEEIANIQCYPSSRKHRFAQKYFAGNIANIYVSLFLIVNCFGYWLTYGRYSQHCVSAFSLS